VGFPEAALLATVRSPAAEPAAAGWNCTVTLYDAPAASVIGRLLCPVTANDWPLTLISEICTGSTLAFFSETVALAVWPTATVPNESAVADATSEPVAEAGPVTMLPHPDKASIAQQLAAANRPIDQPHCLCCRIRIATL
jgi:hypothetical protein